MRPIPPRDAAGSRLSSIGAGPTGVELAGQLAELSHRSLRGNFRHIDPAEARVVLLGAAPTILPAFPEALRERAARDLRDMGVEIHVGTMVTGVDERGHRYATRARQMRRIEAATKIWAAGVQASPLGRVVAEAAGVELDRAGRVKVEPDCTLPGHPEVFVIGDLMSLDNLPGVTQVAIQSGQPRRAHHHSPPRGRHDAPAFPLPRLRARWRPSRACARSRWSGRLRVSGFPAWVLWLVVRLMTLTGFKNRLSVLFNWTVAFLGRGRAQRVITAQQVFARQALEVQARERARATLSTTARADSARP